MLISGLSGSSSNEGEVSTDWKKSVADLIVCLVADGRSYQEVCGFTLKQAERLAEEISKKASAMAGGDEEIVNSEQSIMQMMAMCGV